MICLYIKLRYQQEYHVQITCTALKRIVYNLISKNKKWKEQKNICKLV